MAAAELTPFYYDLHIHTCLSPCGENDMTPATVAGLSALAGLDIIAICDHNTAGNVQAVQQAAAALAPGLLVIPGIELTCAEELHMVCLFPTAEAAEAAGEEIYAALPPISNREEIFGAQLSWMPRITNSAAWKGSSPMPPSSPSMTPLPWLPGTAAFATLPTSTATA
ncbi:MAG: PHP domain-containing protein [Angelakisella sp.]